MDIVIIGTGNTATVLGRKFKEAGHRMVQIFGRKADAANELAATLNTEGVSEWQKLAVGADLYLLAVSDAAIDTVVREWQPVEHTVVHTAASVSKDILKNTKRYGVFYPFQSMRKEAEHLPEIPVLIDASDDATMRLLETLAFSISTTVSKAGDDERAKLHLAAVFASNFTNHLYLLAEQYCQQQQLDFKLLLPLVRETANRLEVISPLQAQTGPAVRGDEETIQKHLRLLDNLPQLKSFYEWFTDSIQRKIK